MVPAGVCDLCFGHTSEQCAASGGSCPSARVFCFHEHCDTEITWDGPTRIWNPDEESLRTSGSILDFAMVASEVQLPNVQ